MAAWFSRHVPSWGGPVLLVLAGAIFFWPAIRAGFALDDFVHASMVAGSYPAHRAPYDLYNLVDDSSRDALLARGLLPWWTHPHLQISFFRPLASLLRWGDYLLLGSSALPHHLHSFLWWIAVALTGRAFFRRLLPSRAAAVATVIFALSPSHSIPLVWLANREALVSLAFGIPGLLFYVRSREEKSLRFALAATLLFSASLAAGEYGLAFTGYVVAFELFRRGDGLGRRAVGLLPFALPIFLYLGVRTMLGYGAVGSGFYADPLRDPQAFFEVAPARFAALLLDAWLALDRETFVASLWQTFFVGFAIASLLLVAVALRPTYRDLVEPTRTRFRWLLLGSTLSLAPMLAVSPSSRLVGACLLGIAAIVGLVVERAWFSHEPRSTLRGFASVAAFLLAFIHLVHGPASAWLIGRTYRESTDRETQNRESVRARLDPIAQADLVVVRGGASAPFHLPFSIDPAHQLPARFAVLSQTTHVLVLRRDARVIELIAAQNDTLIPLGEANIYLDMHRVFTVGEVIPFPGGRATINDLAFGRPRIVQFEFDHDLDTSPLVWLSETAGGFIDARPPRLGMGTPYDP